MAKGGRRYPLVIYSHMIDRWRSDIFLLGLALLGLAGAIYFWGMEEWRWMTIGGIGVFSIFVSIVLWIARKSAYIQPYPEYIRLVTPFLRLNVSYKRFRRTTSANMGALFPRNSITKAQADIMELFAGMTAIVIELTKFPIAPSTLRIFLSPLFFKDKTPHFVILVDDWMRLSTEIDSMRSGIGGAESLAAQQPKRNQSILSKLPGKK
jgi:hypothetical protein